MTEKKLTPLMKCHLALMVLLTVMSAVVIVILLTGTLVSGSMMAGRTRAGMIFRILLNLVNVIALSAGITYLLERYGKKAAAVYKLFMLSAAVSSVFYAITVVYILTRTGSSTGTAAAFMRAVPLMAVKVVLLVVLTFGRDLGKRNTWIIYAVILVLDVIYSVLCISPGDQPFAAVTGVLSRLALTGTVGLAIRGKYADKDARGTK